MYLRKRYICHQRYHIQYENKLKQIQQYHSFKKATNQELHILPINKGEEGYEEQTLYLEASSSLIWFSYK